MPKICQNVKKMSNVKKSNTQTMEKVHKKKIHMRFTHIDVNFDVKYEGHQNCSKTLSMHILRVFGHHHMWHQNWHQYVWTSLCQFIFLWTSSIVHVFDFLTFDIFLTTWHLFDSLTCFWQLDIFLTYGQQDTWAMGHMGKVVSWLILKIEMWYLGGWGTWPMGYMGNWAHDHNFLNTAWIFTKILLDIDINVFYLNKQWYSHDGPFEYKNS